VDLFEKCRQYTQAREVMAAGIYPYFHRIESAQDPEVTVEGRRMIMIGSNNYLGLTNHPKVKEAAVEAIRRYGTGCAGSRFLNGTLAIHEELEDRLARFFRKEAAIVFSTGFQANLGAISALVGKDNVAIIDKMDHASIFDGCRLSFGQIRKYRHNDVQDLDRILREENSRGAFVVVDGVFSMEGDVAKLPEIAAVCRSRGARLMVDDAHGIGVLGRGGRGTAEHFEVEREVDVIMGTYSKSMATIGGFLVADEPVIHYVKHHARPLIFSASLPPASVAAVLAVLEIIDQEPERRERLWANTRKMMKGLRELGFDTGPTETPIVPVVAGEDLLVFRMWRRLFDEGVFANPIVSPAVPPGRALIRTSYMATHTPEQLDRVLEVFAKVGRELGLIG
jgi:8-amino-7-oxononanoate synthase